MMEQHPFPHLVIDGLWDAKELRQIAAEFPDYQDPRWQSYPMHLERGKKAGDRRMWGPFTRAWFDWVRTDAFRERMTRWTGIKDLIADDLGGGMHCTGEGGRLGMHVDFSLHPNLPNMTRRINMLTFLNDKWERDWGGVLYLGEHREVEILPLFNTTVVFETSSKSYHGHPDPIVGNHLRRSLACYFYAPRRPDDDLIASTVWMS